ncbi:hypothetical protein BC939DRAFT_151494 [Gamsiella multidivaricata]|uniref:uncharacterized protein n=1 Tax=Gamsiella multidivaricata TaxID=101098 RepID=UPI002220C4CA|nr:uncharacterized protein BC939DRAFT_151494 [Gamsiella multidivaricata]KAI7824042.1 hypothetical protein BC939DRAFT_151494 [Gamsiella multidivaricata]
MDCIPFSPLPLACPSSLLRFFASSFLRFFPGLLHAHSSLPSLFRPSLVPHPHPHPLPLDSSSFLSFSFLLFFSFLFFSFLFFSSGNPTMFSFRQDTPAAEGQPQPAPDTAPPPPPPPAAGPADIPATIASPATPPMPAAAATAAPSSTSTASAPGPAALDKPLVRVQPDPSTEGIGWGAQLFVSVFVSPFLFSVPNRTHHAPAMSVYLAATVATALPSVASSPHSS